MEVVEKVYKYKTSRKLISQKKVNSITEYLDQIKLYERDKEELWIIGAYNQETLLGVEKIAIGTKNKIMFAPAEVMKSALRMNANFIMLIHNHTNGSKKESSADKKMKEHIKKSCDILGMKLVSSIICTGKGDYHFYDPE